MREIDFAENYISIFQDPPQSYHWVNTQATLHLVLMYFYNQESNPAEVFVRSFAISSDCLEHDKDAVHAFWSEVLAIQKRDLPQLKNFTKEH
ncbi:hypothetical protein HPB48_009300 [Haemaphysalis longicornis]|uniref:Uncharacterized protein n=1 Tax=Haemaphysalis longicornis TaxID=44386 RepID=A0A9J6FPI5_HAELO|nr:hypothetical protein HPB48_009300 [Haemaphysalis longicornis]